MTRFSRKSSACVVPRHRWILGLALLLCSAAPAMASGGEPAAAPPSMTHRMMMLVIQFGLILFAARMGNIMMTKLRLPGVIGELLAGILIGHHLLGKVPVPGLFPHGLFPLLPGMTTDFPVTPELYGVCAVASVVLLFHVGLETDIKLFMRYSVAGSLVGIGGVTVSFLLGDFMGMAFSKMLFGEARGFFDPACLFLGIISTATSVGITARILSEQRKLDSPEGVTVLAGAVVDDVLGIILLAIGVGVIEASKGTDSINWAAIGHTAVKAVGIWLAATAIGLVASRKLGTLLKWFRERSSIAVMALGLAMVLAGLFEEAGLAMIIGAYVMGLSLSRTDIAQMIQEKLHPISVLLVPVFFAVMGMLVNVRMLASKEVLLFGAVYTVVAAIAKIAGGGLPALACGFNWRGALRVGAGMLPRGEVTLIIAGVGIAAGLLDPKIFGVVILMTLASSLISPPLLVALFRSPAPGLRKPVAAAGGQKHVFHFPSRGSADLLITKLLAAFDAEGFFVHVLDRNSHLYQLRKDDVVISLQREGTDISFECGRSQVPFINTAMVEVVAELEQTMRELRKPIDSDAIGRRMQDAGTAKAARALSLADYLARDALVPRLKSSTKQEVMEELLQVLVRQGVVRDEEQARRDLWSREESMSTGMQYSIAIPHARTNAVDKLVCAVGLQPRGIDFDSMDGQPSRIFVLTLSPAGAAAPHVRFMSTVSQILGEEGRIALLSCETPDEMYAILTGQATEPPATNGLGKKFPLPFLRGAGRTPATTLADFLSADTIKVELSADTVEGVIDELLDTLCAKGQVRDRELARQELLERERQMSCAMESGVAIPHARTTGVRNLVCAIGIKRDGINCGAPDGKPSAIFVLTLSPRNRPAPHVQFMAMIARALDNEGRKRVLDAKDAQGLLNALIG